MPTRAENPKAINKMSAEMMVGQPAMLEAAWAPATPSPTPIIPPILLRTQLMPLTQDSLDLVHDLSHLLRGFGREITGPDGPQELGAHDLPLGGGEGYEHHIILIVPPCVIPFGVEGAHNLKRHVLD